MAIQPHLFIGVGGTGGKTVGMIQYFLHETLKRAGVGKLPDAWQFLHVDVPAICDAKHANDLFYYLKNDEYLALTTNDVNYQAYDRAISQSVRARAVRPDEGFYAWDSWRPIPPEMVTQDIRDGAGQMRVLGRICALSNVDKIQARLQDKLTTLTNARHELRDVERALGLPVADGTDRIDVTIIGSLAGGSGSGMLLDVCDLLKGLDGTLAPVAYIFSPEVFAKNGQLEPGMAPNTLMAVHEIANAKLRIQGPTRQVGRDWLYQALHATRPQAQAVGGPDCVYLVGIEGAGIVLENADQVYTGVARTITDVALDANLSTYLYAHARGNVVNATLGVPDQTGLKLPNTMEIPAFNAIGFARLTVGRDYFQRYAATRLQRMAVERLLEEHLKLRRPGDGMTDELLLQQLADAAWPPFLLNSGLDEVGANRNEIFDQIYPDAEMKAFVDSLVKRLPHVSLADMKGRVLVTQVVADAGLIIEDQLSMDNRGSLAQELGSLLRENTRNWAVKIRTDLAQHVIYTVARYGLPVTVELISRLIAQLTTAATELAESDYQYHLNAFDKATGGLNPTEVGSARLIHLESNEMAGVQESLGRALTAWARARASKQVSTVVSDFIENMIKPWHQALSEAEGVLRRKARPDTGKKPFDALPADIGVPDHLRPSRLEFCLDEVDEFPATFNDVISQSVGPDYALDAGQLDLLAEVVTQIVSAKRMRVVDQDSIKVVEYASVWQPMLASSDGVSHAARIMLSLSWDDLEQRIFSWMADDQKTIGKYLNENFVSYFHPGLGAGLLDQRRHRFVTQLSKTLGVAKPLAIPNRHMLNLVRNYNAQGNLPLSVKATNISLPAEADPKVLQTAVQAVVNSAFGEHGRDVKMDNKPRSEFTVVTTWRHNLYAFEIDSIMAKVSEQFIQLGHENEHDIWDFRVCRPLTEWLPLGPLALQALVTGYLAARLLGRASWDLDEFPYRQRVWVPKNGNGGEVITLRVNTHRRNIDDTGMVGALLERFALTMLDAYGQNSIDVLKPFATLIQLGSDIGNETVNNVFGRWLSGREGVTVPEMAMALAREAETLEERIECTNGYLQYLAEQLEKAIDVENIMNVNLAKQNALAEVYHLVTVAITQISKVVEGFQAKVPKKNPKSPLFNQ